MFGVLKRSQTISTKFAVPRLATALVHTQPENTTITALGARLGLSALNTQTLKQALTHKSVEEEENNASLEFIGKRVVGLFATEYIHCKYPILHQGALNTTLRSYIGNKSLSKIATEVGLQHSISWKTPEGDEKLGHATVMADCMNALIGAIYKEQGEAAAKKFIHEFILARDFDVRPSIKVQEPKRHVSILLKNLNREPATSRLLSETGRHSSSPVFIVGVFSGKDKIGEGFGSSIKMAEFRACQDALTQYYGQEQKNFVLPSDAHKVDQYDASPLAQIEVMI
ncbi:ribonuclease III [Backusella circina FSU 941]|nr:ribonuclease III [Backusella circina FSU 941]